MKKKFFIFFLGLFLGVILGFGCIIAFLANQNNPEIINPLAGKKEVIGFLPYWLISNVKPDYSKYITTLAYFGLRVDENGNIQKLLNNDTQEEPGWSALKNGKLDELFANTLNNGGKLSVVIASGNSDAILGLISDPVPHAANLVSDLKPIVAKYNFSDINLDIEYTHSASPSARTNFAKFVTEVKKGFKDKSLTVEIAPTDPIKNNLIDPLTVGKLADKVVLMAYDFHSNTSYVTGPVAPIDGAGEESEYDVTAAVEKSLDLIPPQKLILGIPTYGYEWETLNSDPRSSDIPNTGVVASNRRAEELLQNCATCSAQLDERANERYITYFDQDLGDYHTIFFPNSNSTLSKMRLTNQLNLGGLALWALGYEGNSIMDPLKSYVGK